jgi:outer membrane protein OmpA-like peptidoglycan-associated protein
MFGDHYVKYYKSVMESYPKYESFVNMTYAGRVIDRTGSGGQVAQVQPTFQTGKKIDQVVAQRGWSIEFDTGKATIRPESMTVLNELLDQVIITNLAVEIRGHTDSVGSPESNVVLSKKRAEAVKVFLMAQAEKSITDERVRTKGFGQQVPLADNGTAEGRAKNRRVEVLLGTSN